MYTHCFEVGRPMILCSLKLGEKAKAHISYENTDMP